MTMLRATIACLSIFVVSWTCSVSHAQESPLAYFSDQVDVIVRLREPDQSFEKLAKVVNKIQPGVGDVVHDQQNEVLGQLISNPSLTGVDLSRDWYVGVYGEKDEVPVIVFAIPATNVDDMVGALGTGLTTRVHKTWVLYSESEKIPTATESASAATALVEASRQRLASGDLGIYVNAAHLSGIYADQIELMQEKVLDALNNLRFTETDSGVNLDAVARIYGTMAESFFQMIDDAESSSVSISLSESEIGIDKFVTFKSDSESAKAFADSPQSSFEQLGRLPGNWPFYGGFSGGMEEFMEFGLSSSAEMLKLDDEQKTFLEEMKKDIAKIKFGPLVMGIDIADSASGAMRGASLLNASPIELLKSITRKSQVKLGTLSTDAFEQTTTIQEDAETYGDHKCDLVQVKQVYTDKGDPTGIGRKTQELLMGEEGITTRYCYFKDMYINTFGGGKQLMKDLVSAVESNKSNKLSKFRGSLMTEGNVLVLFDLPGITGRGLKIASKMEGSPLMVNPQAIDNLGQPISYVGIAIGSEGNTLKSQLRVPMEQITGMVKLSVLIAASMRPGI